MSVLTELRSAIRGLRAAPARPSAAVVALALGLAVSAAAASVQRTVLSHPSAFGRSQGLVSIAQTLLSGDRVVHAGLTPSQVKVVGASTESFIQLGIFGQQVAVMQMDAGGLRLTGARVSAALVAHLTDAPVLGRVLTEADEAESAPPVAVLSERIWRDQHLMDSRVLDRFIVVDGIPHQIVGVLGQAFRFPYLTGGFRNSSGRLDSAPEFWVPFKFDSADGGPSGFSLWSAVGILRPGISYAVAAEELDRALPSLPGFERRATDVEDLNAALTAPVRHVVLYAQLAAWLVLLVACVNVGELLVTRLAKTRQDAALRLALGATSAHLVRQAVFEGAMIGSAAAGLGFVLAADLLLLVRVIAPVSVPHLSDARIDSEVVATTLLIGIVAGAAIGASATVRPKHLSLRQLFHTAGVPGAHVERRRPYGLIVATQIALAVALMSTAGLLIASFLNLRHVDPGFDAANLLAFRMTWPESSTVDPAGRLETQRAVIHALAQTPGIESVSASSQPQVRPTAMIEGITVRLPVVRTVTPEFFDTLGASIVAGSGWKGAGRDAMALVNEEFVRRASVQNADIVGRTLIVPEQGSFQVAGVVRNVRYDDPGEAVEPDVYVRVQTNWPISAPTWYVRLRTRPDRVVAALPDVIGRVESGFVLFDIATVEQRRNEATADRRLYAGIGGIFALIGLGLAVTGLYGLVARVVVGRLSEFGIRLALGASPRRLQWMVLRQFLSMVACGIAAGWVLSLLTSRLLATTLIGVSPGDPFIRGAASALLALTATAAVYLPIRRATSRPPSVVMRGP